MRIIQKGFKVRKTKLISSFLIIILLAGIFGFYFVQPVKAAIRTWDGGGGADTNWSTAANWSADTVPTSADTVVFDNTSDNNSTVDASFAGTITTININAGYDGTITLARSLTVSTTFSQAAGTFTAAAQTLDINGSFTLSAGAFTASSGTMTVAGSFTISGTPTFTHNSGTVTMDGASGTWSCNNVTFNTFSINQSSGGGGAVKTVNSDCSLPLGANPTVVIDRGTLVLNGTLSGSGTLTVRDDTLQMNSGALLSGFSGLSAISHLTLDGVTFNAGSYTTFNVDGNFTLQNGASFTAPSGTMTVGGNFTNTSGTFTANGGTFKLDGTGTQTIAGSTTFNNLDLTSTSARTVTFTAGTTQTVANQFTAKGVSSGSRITMGSSSVGTQWNLTVNGPEDVKWTNIRDSNACGGRALIANDSTNTANNTCWSFINNGPKNPTYILKGVQINQGVRIFGT